jgi:S-DNA-T family DNA segregation ATPase FtsK/SpoIIIE
VCGPGQYLLIGARSDALSSAYHGPLGEALTFRRAILLDPDPADGIRLGARLPRRIGAVPPGRGYLIEGGDVMPIQMFEPDG